ncbi:MAG: CDP-alcohol phosphatidyltransferase family protein [Chloroflexota bacterium]|nr:CDP-alcohol phosphatidyltransferase family protein [Chloroflexota bacterium]
MWRPAQILSDTAHRLAEPVGWLVGKTGVSPNSLTIFGFLINFGVAWLISQGHFIYGGILILVAGIFDLLDGAVARTMGKVTKFGGLLDSTLDRYSEAVILFGLLWYYVWRPDTSIESLLIFATIVGSLLVSYVRARAEGLNLDAEVGIFRRTMRIGILSLGLVLSAIPDKQETVMLYTLWVLAIGTNFTAVHRLFYVWVKARKDQTTPSSPATDEGNR